MIVAHHLGEELLPMLVATGAAATPVLVVVLRARLSRLVRRLRRRPQDTDGRRAAPAG